MTMRSRPGGREPSADLAVLPAREAEFVRQYVVDCNGAAAARRCGYAAKTAARQAHRLLAKPTAAVHATVDCAIAWAGGCLQL